MRTISPMNAFRKTAAGTAGLLAALWPISQATARDADLDNVELPIQNYAVIDVSGTSPTGYKVDRISLDDENQVFFGMQNEPDDYPGRPNYVGGDFSNVRYKVKKWVSGDVTELQSIALEKTRPDLASYWGSTKAVQIMQVVGVDTTGGVSADTVFRYGEQNQWWTEALGKNGSFADVVFPAPYDDSSRRESSSIFDSNQAGCVGYGAGLGYFGYLQKSDGYSVIFYDSHISSQAVPVSQSASLRILDSEFYPTKINQNGYATGTEWNYLLPNNPGHPSLWDGQNIIHLSENPDRASDLNDQNQIVLQGFNNQSQPTEGYLWESASNKTIFADKLPALVAWQIQHTQPFSLSNQVNPAGPSANPDGSIQILADAGNLGKLVPADASGNEKYLWTRDNAGEWTTSHIKLPDGYNIIDWNTINKNGLIAALGQPPGATTTHALLLFPAEIVSRDKFVAGSLEIPEGLDDLELEFVNATTQENLGSYGQLLGGGSTQIYDAVTDILNTSDVDYGGQPDDQQVFFVKDPNNNRKINFYTCFNAVGEVQIKLRINGKEVGVIKHQLAPAPDFANWITYVDNWVKGDGFDFSDPSSARSAGVPSTGPPRTLRVGPAPQNAAGTELSNLTRACLIPIFNVVAQAEGMEAVALGTFEGVKTGLQDDWAMVKLIKMGAVTGGNWAADSVESELRKWGSDPLKRAGELKQITDRFCEEMIFKPLADLGEASSTWEGFKKKAWGTWDRIKGGAQKAWAITQGNASKLVDGLGSWVDDFNGRMIQGGERVAFQNTPWATDRLLNDFRQAGGQVAYTTGYVFGYCCEQAGIGALTGGDN